MTSADIPEAAYEAAARAEPMHLLLQQNFGYDDSTDPDDCGHALVQSIRAAVAAVWPLALAAGRDQAAADIRAHADRHAPKDGNRAQLTLRRHLFIAERVAAGPMTRAEVVEALNAMFGGEPQP